MHVVVSPWSSSTTTVMNPVWAGEACAQPCSAPWSHLALLAVGVPGLNLPHPRRAGYMVYTTL